MTLGYPIEVTWFWDERSWLGLRLGLGYRNTAWVRTLLVPSSFMLMIDRHHFESGVQNNTVLPLVTFWGERIRRRNPQEIIQFPFKCLSLFKLRCSHCTSRSQAPKWEQCTPNQPVARPMTDHYIMTAF